MWDDIIWDTLFIGQTIDDLNQEIRTNTWSISMNAEERANTSSETLMDFFAAVITNRREQIRQSDSKHGMLFYVWHDIQASQLRFSLISDFHSKLPFGAKTKPSSLEAIVEEFLSSYDHIPFSILEMFDYYQEEQRSEDHRLPIFVLPVFVVQLL